MLKTMLIKLFVISFFLSLVHSEQNIDASSMHSNQGFRIYGEASFPQMVGGAGDVNDDGAADVFTIDPNSMGANVYIIFGAKAKNFSDIGIPFGSTQGFTITCLGLNASATGLGDVNGDGIDDFLVGSQQYSNGDGAAVIIFGGSNAFSEICFGQNQFKMTIPNATLQVGALVGGIGDINGDGLADMAILVVGEDWLTYKNATIYIVFGNTAYTADYNTINLNQLSQTQGFKISAGMKVQSISSAGDVNGDGIGDMVIGLGVQNSYVIYGQSGTFPSEIDLNNFNDNAYGFIVSTPNGYITAINGAGDVNGDGIDDIICSDPLNITGIFGAKQWFPLNVSMSELTKSQGFSIEPFFEEEPQTLGKVGDVNGDGIDDFFIGGNTVTIIYGNENGFTGLGLNSIRLNQGYQITSNSISPQDFGVYAGCAGDVNADGFPDVIIASPNDSMNLGFEDGLAYVVFSNISSGVLRMVFAPLFIFIHIFIIYVFH